MTSAALVPTDAGSSYEPAQPAAPRSEAAASAAAKVRSDVFMMIS